MDISLPHEATISFLNSWQLLPSILSLLETGPTLRSCCFFIPCGFWQDTQWSAASWPVCPYVHSLPFPLLLSGLQRAGVCWPPQPLNLRLPFQLGFDGSDQWEALSGDWRVRRWLTEGLLGAFFQDGQSKGQCTKEEESYMYSRG